MSKEKTPVLSIVLYVIAGILLIYSVWATTYSANIISTAVAQNQLVPQGNEFEIVSFYMTNIAQYVLFAIVLASLGWIIQTMPEAVEYEYEEMEYEDDELEERAEMESEE